MTETVAPPTSADSILNGALADRVSKLERQLKKVRHRLRRYECEPLIDVTPELVAELERRMKEADDHPESLVPAEKVFADLREKLARCRD